MILIEEFDDLWECEVPDIEVWKMMYEPGEDFPICDNCKCKLTRFPFLWFVHSPTRFQPRDFFIHHNCRDEYFSKKGYDHLSEN